MKIRVAGIQKLSLVNGDGCRLVVFVQGCAHACPECHNPDTWDFNGGEEWTIPELADYISQVLTKHPLDGITLSGGDPFYQADECADLIDELHERGHDQLNVWVYTGFMYDEVKNTRLAQMVNVIVDGPFLVDQRAEGMPYGSTNQRVIRLR